MAESLVPARDKASPAKESHSVRPLGHNGAHDKPAPRVGKKRAPRAASRAPVVREARELEALLQVSRTLSAGNDPADRAVLDLVRNVFGWDYAALWEVDPASRVASLLGASGDPALFPIERDLKRSIVPGSGLHGMAWQKSGPVVHSLASPLIGCERSAWALGQGLQSGVCCAAVVRGGPVHLLEVFRRGESDSGASDVALTENVAHLLASQRAQSQALRVADELRAEQAASRAALEHEQSRLEQHNQRIGSMLRVTEAAVGGDLRVDAQFDGTDALSDVGRALSQLLNKLRESFSEFGTHAQALGRSSNELTDASRQLSADSKETSTQASVVSTAAGQVSANVQTVAAGVEEMTASIKEIANSANDAARVAIEGVRVAERTNDTVAKLGDSSAEIGKVIKVITSIAQQTNLLALNATIEAGKGFAVVANEVKELAKETAKATEDISQKIEAIQEDTRRAVDAIARISEIIRQINDIQSTIAAAVEQQTATTNEISRNISEAAHGSSEIAQSVTHVAKSAARTTQVAGDCELAASRLGRLSADFHDLTTRFRY